MSREIKDMMKKRKEYYINNEFDGKNPTNHFEIMLLDTKLQRDMEVINWMLSL